jgi:succinate dehydrogenase / fumarate reductase cytochrome b subunit
LDATVTSATATDNTVPLIGGKHHFLLRRLHSLTGIVFGGYVATHLIINATLAQGAATFQTQVDKIHSLPFLMAIEWLLLYIPIIYHTVYGTWIILTGQPNNGSYPYFKNTLYLLQRFSALILAAFIFYHVLAMKGLLGAAFDPARAAVTVRDNMNSHWFVVGLIYPIGILAACYHTANGFWTAGITWGLTISAAGQKRWGMLCVGLFVLMSAAGMTALFAVIAGQHAGG